MFKICILSFGDIHNNIFSLTIFAIKIYEYKNKLVKHKAEFD